MWAALCIVGFFHLVYGAIGASYFDDSLRCGNADQYNRVNAPSCDALRLLQASFIIAGLTLLFASFWKLNAMKLVSLIAACVFALVAILGLAYIGAYMSDKLTEHHPDGTKSAANSPGVYIFGCSVGLFFDLQLGLALVFVGIFQNNKRE